MSALEYRWAYALMRTAESPNEKELVLDELKVVQKLISKHKNYFNSPLMPLDEQEKLLRDVLTDSVCGLTIEFLCLLARRRKMKILPAIVNRFEDLVSEELGRAEITLSLPFEPSAELLKKLHTHCVERGLIAERQKAKTKINVVIDKSLLGGFVAECGGFKLDESIKSRLSELYSYGR